MSKNKKMSIRIDDHLRNDIESCKKTYKGKVTNSDIVREALKDHINRDINDIQLTSYNVQRLSERFENLEETMKVFIDFFAFFVQAWFAHTPELPDNESKIAMWERAAARLEKLCTSFKRNSKNDNFFVKTILNSKEPTTNSK